MRAMSASTRKIPDPIIEPITRAVELNRPSVGTSFGPSGCDTLAGLGMIREVVTYSKFYWISTPLSLSIFADPGGIASFFSENTSQ
jgi:hypothetical protein